MKQAILLVSHGTVHDLEDLEAFVTRVRRGRPAPPDAVRDLRRRYEAIGGRSPLSAINARLAEALATATGERVAMANRLATPFVRDVVAELASQGVTRVAVVALAQHSVHIYAADARAAAEGTGVSVRCAPAWGRLPALTEAFAARIAEALDAVPRGESVGVIATAHSLPRAVVEAGDPYERDVRGASADVEALVRARCAGRPLRWSLAFQSQGMGTPGEKDIAWLGPDLATSIQGAAEQGAGCVVFAPIGFLADHVEVLYDLDVEARGLVEARGMTYRRARSLNADADLVAILAALAGPLLADG